MTNIFVFSLPMEAAIILAELEFKAIRSSGAGGQHVNKVSSKVVVSYNLLLSEGLSVEEKELLVQKLASKLTKEGLLIMSADESRSQFRNKAIVRQRLIEMLRENLIKPTKRKPTKPSYGSKQRKLKKKAIQGEKKKLRKPPQPD